MRQRKSPLARRAVVLTWRLLDDFSARSTVVNGDVGCPCLGGYPLGVLAGCAQLLKETRALRLSSGVGENYCVHRSLLRLGSESLASGAARLGFGSIRFPVYSINQIFGFVNRENGRVLKLVEAG